MSAAPRRRTETLLIADDEAAFVELLGDHLAGCGFRILKASDGVEALQLLKKHKVDLLLTDLQMPRMTGLEVVETLARQDLLPPTVVMSAYGSLETALQAVRLGAIDYIPKPFRLPEMELKVRLAMEKAAVLAAKRPRMESPENDAAEPSAESELIVPTSRIFYGMVGQSPPMLQLFRQVERVARFGSTVLITGESGTGKELVAHALHQASPRARLPFVAVNCGAIPQNLLESELFGHVRGAFTDATSDRKGLFEEAHGGTLFLDEIVDLPLHLQVKLLRVLQEGEVRRVGSNKAISVDVRVAAASAVPARQKVREGAFREDLFYRLSVIELVVPPLRERKEDIPLLVEHIVERANQRLGTRIRGLQPQALARLHAWHWPGNVRELQNAIEQACVMAETEMITADLLHLGEAPRMAAPPRVEVDAETLSIPAAVEATERALIVAALQRTGGNRTHAAELLDISPRNLQYKIKQYAVDSPAPVGRPPRQPGS
jgi:two-component system response regulator AtoC